MKKGRGGRGRGERKRGRVADMAKIRSHSILILNVLSYVSFCASFPKKNIHTRERFKLAFPKI